VDGGPEAGPGGGITVLRNRGDASFDPREHGLPTAGPSRSVAAADLDGDGDIDLVATQQGLGYVTLYPNAGDGTFGPLGAVQAMNRLGSVLAEDLDADGDSDLFVSDVDDKLSAVLENLGNGWTWKRNFLQDTGGACTADMDRDGLPDLVAPRAGNLQIFRNMGLLAFAEGDSAYLQYGARVVASADMDADGDGDIIALSQVFVPGIFERERISIVRNDGGVLGGSLFINGTVAALAAADLDGDGDVDLAAKESILRNSGRGDFPPEDRTRHAQPDNRTTTLALGDIDGDADLDLVKASFADAVRGPRLQVQPNDGAAGFQNLIELFSDADSVFERALISVADIDGDRDLDIVAVAVPFQISLFVNDGDGTFLAGDSIPAGGNPLVLATGDLDGDGLADVMPGNRAVQSSANVSVFRGRRDGTLLVGRNYAVGSEAAWIALGDTDGDGDLDAAANGVHILSNNGSGAFESRRVHDEETLSGILADLDGDGDLDVAAGTRTLLLNDGAGGFDSRERPAQTEGLNLLGADLDGDRDIDLVEQGINVTWNLGAGSFEAPWMTEVPTHADLTGLVDRDADGDLDLTATSGPFAGFLDAEPAGRFESARWRLLAPGELIPSLVLADLDRKGGLDMVFITATPRGQNLWHFTLVALLDGVDAALREEVLDLGIPTRWPAFGLEAADLDADGDMDFAVLRSACAPECGSRLFLVWNDGDGKLSASSLPAGSQPIERLAPVDIDGDGDLDLVTEGVTVYRNGGGAVLDGPSSLADACCGLAAGDVDGDGDADIVTGSTVFRNTGDGTAFEISFHRRPLGEDLAMGDLDGDGFPDVVGVSRTGGPGLNLLVNDRMGAFDASVWLRSLGRVKFLEDLDADGRPDIVSGEEGGFRILWNRVTEPIALGEHTDLDMDGRIDGCHSRPFTRGDVTGDRKIDISDAIALLRRLFRGDQPPGCLEAADVDDDSLINVSDPILILDYLFQGGAPPAHPGPDAPCSPDFDADGFDCNAYPSC
jgi:large repetitive protein